MNEAYTPPRSELALIQKPKGAAKEWGSCGIAAISAATGVPPLDVLAAMPGWPGYTSSKMIIKTLEDLGFGCTRRLVPKTEQKIWPTLNDSFPSKIALGRIYWGEQKHDGSHWICLKWFAGKTPLFYDSLFENNGWYSTDDISHYPGAFLKSLYFITKGTGK